MFGFIGRSGAGKTTLILEVIARLRAEGYIVSAIKRAHDGLDLDRPGKDSWRMREAGCREVMIVGDQRYALLHEYREQPEPSPLDLAARLDGADIVLLEGFRAAPVPMMEVYRAALRRPMLWQDHPSVVAIASDSEVDAPLPRFDLADSDAVARFLLAHLGIAP